MSEHTKGPLEFSSAGFGSKSGITVDEYFIRRPEDDVAVAADVIDPETGAPSESNARRLVACWNACQNIATDAIESGSLDLFQLQLDRMMLTQQRDELLSIARRWAAVDAQWHPDRYESEKAELLINTKAAIAKATA
ncbi:hypothetical protein [Pseudomonas rhodesiae]|uniref:hypothetical protein n=1 Tax=Pseudomonas rhodesiae TaxID=76760 RepID=UPI0028971689|nr:hypothetical protein [Pseudomonas rhodesiae]